MGDEANLMSPRYVGGLKQRVGIDIDRDEERRIQWLEGQLNRAGVLIAVLTREIALQRSLRKGWRRRV